MNREDIIRLAREARLSNEIGAFGYPYLLELERFAALVAAAEREACEDIEDLRRDAEQPKHPGYVIGSHWLETAYSRVCAGEAEADVLRDCGWERVDDIDALRRENERLREEMRVLRLYGNKDCTAMADEAMKEAALRREDKP